MLSFSAASRKFAAKFRKRDVRLPWFSLRSTRAGRGERAVLDSPVRWGGSRDPAPEYTARLRKKGSSLGAIGLLGRCVFRPASVFLGSLLRGRLDKLLDRLSERARVEASPLGFLLAGHEPIIACNKLFI